MRRVPQYIVSDGISNGRWWGTYVRKPNGSLRRVHAHAANGDLLPNRPTRLEALWDLHTYLLRRASDCAIRYDLMCAEYLEQAKRVFAEIQAERDHRPVCGRCGASFYATRSDWRLCEECTADWLAELEAHP